MRSVLVTGGTGTFGRPIAEKLRGDWEVYTLQRHPHEVDDLSHWLDVDLMEPQQTVTGVHQLWNDINEGKTCKLSAIVHAAGASGYDDWHTLTTFDLQAAVRLHVLEPLLLTKYLLDYEAMEWDATAVWLEDSRIPDMNTVIPRTAKAGMRPMVEAFSCGLPDTFRNVFVECADALRIGVTANVATKISEILA